MKKMLLALALVLVSTLTGCNKSFTNTANGTGSSNIETTSDDPKELVPEEGAELVIWEDSDSRIEYMNHVAKKFKEKYKIDVKIEQVTDLNRLVQDAPAGLGPDIFEAPHDQVGTMLTAGLIQPNDTSAETMKDDFGETVYNCLTFDGKVYGYPLTLNTYLLIYNKDIVGETAPETFQEIFDFAQTFNDPTNRKYALMWQVGNSYYTNAFIAGYGGYIFGNNGTDPEDIGLNSKEFIEGAEYVKSFESILNVNTADIEPQVIDGLFQSGKVAYTISGQWSVTQYQSAGVNIGVSTLPKMANDETPKTFLGVQTLYVNAYSEYPNAAKLFAEMATSEKMFVKRYEITNEVPARLSLLTNEAIMNDPIASAFIEQAQSSVPMPSITQMNSVWDPYSNALKSIWDEDIEPETALNKSADTISKLIN